MKSFLAIFILSILSFNSFSQVKLKAFFERKVDTLVSDSKKELTQTFKITVPKQTFMGTVTFSFVKNDFQPDDAEIFLPNNRTLEFDPSKEVSKEFSIKFPRNMKNDRMIILELKATKADGSVLTLEDGITKYSIYIKPFVDDSLSDEKKNGYEFWLFTGSNLDLLDGPIFKDLYFKGSVLVNASPKNSKNWFYLTFGKNRYTQQNDSLVRVPFSNGIKNFDGDSISITKGYYNAKRTIVTDNLFASIDYLRKIDYFSSETKKLFFTGGFYFGLQTITKSYQNSNIVSKTKQVVFKRDTSFQPMLTQEVVRQFNYNLSLGFTYIISTNAVNIKTQFLSGINNFNYPYSTISTLTKEYNYYAVDKNLFAQIKLEATVLNPGISLGFEAFLRQQSIPLFNISLTKVFDLKNLGSLFGKISTIKI